MSKLEINENFTQKDANRWALIKWVMILVTAVLISGLVMDITDIKAIAFKELVTGFFTFAGTIIIGFMVSKPNSKGLAGIIGKLKGGSEDDNSK